MEPQAIPMQAAISGVFIAVDLQGIKPIVRTRRRLRTRIGRIVGGRGKGMI